MKIDQPVLPINEVEEIRNINVQKSQVLMGKIKYIKGITLWEIDVKNNTINPAEYETKVNFNEGGSPIRKVVVKPNCIYIQGLRAKDAIRKLKNSINKQK